MDPIKATQSLDFRGRYARDGGPVDLKTISGNHTGRGGRRPGAGRKPKQRVTESAQEAATTIEIPSLAQAYSPAERALCDYLRGLTPLVRQELRAMVPYACTPNGMRLPADFLNLVDSVLQERT